MERETENVRFQISDFKTSRRRGFTLVEVMVVLAVIAVMLTLAIPSFNRAVEQSQANIAAANLRAIWAAEQWWWLDSTPNTYTDLNTLASNGLIDRQIIASTSVYVYTLPAPGSTTFIAYATRTGSPTWTGMYQVDQTGDITGQISASNQNPIKPGFQ